MGDRVAQSAAYISGEHLVMTCFFSLFTLCFLSFHFILFLYFFGLVFTPFQTVLGYPKFPPTGTISGAHFTCPRINLCRTPPLSSNTRGEEWRFSSCHLQQRRRKGVCSLDGSSKSRWEGIKAVWGGRREEGCTLSSSLSPPLTGRLSASTTQEAIRWLISSRNERWDSPLVAWQRGQCPLLSPCSLTKEEKY